VGLRLEAERETWNRSRRETITAPEEAATGARIRMLSKFMFNLAMDHAAACCALLCFARHCSELQ
jgi:hypothetical protein